MIFGLLLRQFLFYVVFRQQIQQELLKRLVIPLLWVFIRFVCCLGLLRFLCLLLLCGIVCLFCLVGLGIRLGFVFLVQRRLRMLVRGQSSIFRECRLWLMGWVTY